MQVSVYNLSMIVSSVGRHRRSHYATMHPFGKSVPVIHRALSLASSDGWGNNKILLDWGSLGLGQRWLSGGTQRGAGWVGMDERLNRHGWCARVLGSLFVLDCVREVSDIAKMNDTYGF